MRPPIFALIAVLIFSFAPSRAAESTDAKAELKELVAKIQKKLGQEKPTEQDLAAELKEFDSIVARHAGEKSDAVAEVVFMKAVLYIEVLNNAAKGSEILAELRKDFPGTKPAAAAEQVAASLEKQAAAEKIQAALKVGAPFPSFEEADLDGKPISVAALKGKVALIDFWATWCGPCVAELPNVLETYEKYHDKGFAIVGISLDENKAALTSFIAKRKMTWPQYFDGLGWGNKLAQKYGIVSIPATFLLDQKGNILAKDLRGDELKEAVAKALGDK